MTTASNLAPYDALVRIAEQELELVCEQRYSEAAQLAAQRAQVMRMLPRPAVRGAGDRLERALAIQGRVSIELLKRREQVLLALRRVEMGRRTAQGYARSLPRSRRGRIFEQA